MGCISSSDTKRTVLDSDNVKQSSSAPPFTAQTHSSQSLVKKSESVPHASVPYESHLSASLVRSSDGNVPFHGLLNDKHKLNLKRNNAVDPVHKLFDRSLHPHDDSCTSSDHSKLTIVSGTAMTMPYVIIVAQPSASTTVRAVIDSVFERANTVINGWNPKSEISAFNTQPPEKKIQLSPDLRGLFEIVDNVHSMTDGRYDPTTGVISIAFETCINERERPPLPAEIAPFKHALGWKRRILRKETYAARLNSHTVIDLDGISKGYVVDRLVDALKNAGFPSCYVDWAGDVRASGEHPEGRPWRSAVVRPPALSRVFQHWRESSLHHMLTSDDIAYFANYSAGCADGCAIATSGDYFSIQKYGFHHIVNTISMAVLKANQTSVGSVCVAANSCVMADALATAAMTFTCVTETIDFLRKLKSNYPHIVYGFCAMGRGTADSQSEIFTDGLFIKTPGKKPSEMQADSPLSELVSPDESERFSDTLRENIYQRSVIFHLDGSDIKSDSFVSCSMNPHPLITFSPPLGFVRNIVNSSEDVESTLQCTVLQPLVESSGGAATGINVDLRFHSAHQKDEIVVVGAAIEDVDFGNISAYNVTHGTHAVSREIGLEVNRSKFQFLPVAQKAKLLLRNIPAMVWVVTTTAADQTPLALTATSVCVPSNARGCITFNISHTSAFFAGFGGVTSLIRVNALSTELETLARKFVNECQPSNNDMHELESLSLVSASCVVHHVADLQDHTVVIARVYGVNKNEQRKPLIWVDGNYIAWK